MSGRIRRVSAVAAFCAAVGLAVVSIALAATKAINLDGNATNAAESAVSLNILTTYPAKVEDKVTNRAVGDAYTFRWISAGPGAFSSQLAPGTTAGVGVTWDWQTVQTIYSITGSSCANDVCFTKSNTGPDPAPTNTPAWAVPGRTVIPNSVTVSSASLTSSLITFFSPPQTLVTATSSVRQLANGEFAFSTTYTNNTNDPVHLAVPPAPPGCCDYPNQLNCDGKCEDYLNDDQNCGGCGIVCGGECPYGGEVCSFGECTCDYGESAAPEDTTRSVAGGRAPWNAAAFGATSAPPSNHALCEPSVLPPPAPVCETDGFETVVPPHDSVTDCHASGFLPKEIPGVLTVCGSSIPDGEPTCPGGNEPASQGTFMQFVENLDRPIPTSGALLTLYDVTVVDDTNGDGVLQPGETGKVFIKVLNAGPEAYTSPAATLSSPPVDMTPDNGVSDPASVTISAALSPYSPDVAPVVPSGSADCNGPFAPGVPSVNTLAYHVTVPPTHPGDVSRPFTLSFTGNVGGTPTAMTVPVSIGIGSAEADLGITKQGSPATPVPGGNLSYTLNVTNHGPLDASAVVVKDDIPAGTTFVSFTATAWTCTAPAPGATGTLTCSKPGLTSGSSSSITLVVKVNTTCPTPASIANVATVSSNTPDELTDNNKATSTNTVAAPAPVVAILQPSTDQLGLPSLAYPVNISFRSTSSSPIARETVSLEGCLLWDGLTYGDRDGLLTDEYMLQTNKNLLCQAMARCGYTVLYYPKINVAATDNCGRTGTASVIYRKNLLKTEVCAR